jgi:HK97 family phage major capsid protein
MTIAQQIGRAGAALETASRSREFAEYARCLMLAKGNPESALHYAGASSRRVVDAIKADVAGTTTGDLSVAPYRILSEGFTATLNNAAFDALLADANIVPLHTQFAVTATDVSAAAVGEGLAKPLGALTLGNGTLQERRAAVIVAVSNDILRFNTAAGLLENSLRTGVSSAVDKIFVDALIAGTSPLTASGTAASDVLFDLRRLMDSTGSGSNSRFHLIVGPGVARRLATMATTAGNTAFQMTVNGGTIAGVSVHVSDTLTTAALLVDANALVASADAVSIRMSQHASLEMSDAPGMAVAQGSPPAPAPPAGSPPSGLVSMFQTNSTAILAERVFGFSLLRATAAQSLSGIQWGLVGSPAA